MRDRLQLGFLFAAPLLFGALALTGCSRKQNTQFVAGFSTQVHVPRDLRAVRVLIQGDGDIKFCKDYNVSNGVVNLPQTIGTAAFTQATAVEITVSGFMSAPDDSNPDAIFTDCTTTPTVGANTARVLRRSVQTYLPGHTLFVPMPLSYSCFDVDCSNVGDGTYTCIGGQCVAPSTETTAANGTNLLPDYDDSMTNGNAVTCFSPSKCLGIASVPATPIPNPGKTLDPLNPDDSVFSDCYYALPSSSGAPPQTPIVVPFDAGAAQMYPDICKSLSTGCKGINVGVTYQGGLVSEVLDYDPNEGYTIPNPAQPDVFQLSPALCALVHPIESSPPPHPIIAVNASGSCLPKTPEQPICTDELTSLPPDASTLDPANQPHCATTTLTPAPSAIYIVMDRSPNMAPFLGDGGVGTVLGFSLSDPALRTTSVAFGFVNGTGDCTTAPSLASIFDGGFVSSASAQDQIATAIASATTVGNGGALCLQNVLNTAYSALAGSSDPAVKSGPNRVALVLITNDSADFAGNGSESLNAIAANGLNAKVYSYAIVPQLPDAGVVPDPQDFNGLAASGGTGNAFVFGVPGSTASGAFNVVVGDLGSCLYDIPRSIVHDGGTSPIISYDNPFVEDGGVSIAETATCEGVDSDAGGGWVIDNGQLRICGQPCSNLRAVLATALGYSVSNYSPTVDIAVTLSTAECLLDAGADGGSQFSGQSGNGFTPLDASAAGDATLSMSDASTITDAGITDGSIGN